MNHFPVLLQRNLHAQRPVRACFARSCCNVVVQEHDLRASPGQCNVKQALSSHITLHPSHFTSDLFSSGFMSSRTADDKSHAAIPMRSATGDSKTPYNYAHTQAHPKQLQATVTLWQKKRQTDRSRNRRTHEVPFIVACSHFTRKNTRFRAPASSPKHSPCNIMQPLQCGSQH